MQNYKKKSSLPILLPRNTKIKTKTKHVSSALYHSAVKLKKKQKEVEEKKWGRQNKIGTISRVQSLGPLFVVGCR